MTDYLTDTPIVARSYCPGCEPDADPVREILDIRWCDQHAPTRDGTDDLQLRSDAYLSGSAEAGGDANRRWCELFHGSGAARTRRESSRRPRRRPTPAPAPPATTGTV